MWEQIKKQAIGFGLFLLYLLISAFLIVIIDETFLFGYYGLVTPFVWIITGVVAILYIPICAKVSRRFQFGIWRFLLFIPFINVIASLALMLSIGSIPLLPKPNFPDDDYGMGFLLLQMNVVYYILFLIGTIQGLSKRKTLKIKHA
ncbi:hypothetical protein [Priestia endophytica]|jgi:hypothetical protein|uniref:hypothetical protein n=1 Tax=Priestia endophytica TaxID=135735 RepID=UPI002E1D2971|nr:hypothetical protein [Priestia endophytica]